MRKMCHVELIEEIQPIENADAIERIRVLGWWGVAKKNQYAVGDKMCIIETDAILPPIPYFEFMAQKKYRVRTCKLRGALSEFLPIPYADRLVIFQQLIQKQQGVEVPIERLGIFNREYQLGDDLTDLLQIKKHEPFVECCQAGQQKGTFPYWMRKTDEMRLASKEGRTFYNELLGKPYYITIKLDGTSGTYYLKDNEFGVCSRNNEYRYDSTKPNYYWYAAKNQQVEEWLRRVNADTGHDYYIQGEIVGPKIQENKLRLIEPTLFVFNMTDLTENRRLTWKEMNNLLEKYHAKFSLVPLYCAGDSFDLSEDSLYELADGYYESGQRREGLVIRHADNIESKECIGEPLSFKVISRKFLLGEK